jgi:autotransporter-associated beta strand protein
MNSLSVISKIGFYWWKITFAVTLTITCASVQAATNSERVASGLSRPVFVTAPTGDSSHLFIVEQWTGKIKILNRDSNTINATPFLTVAGLSTSSEQGLLGLAFDPNYSTNGRFYVNYTDSSGNTQVQRYERSSSDPNIANPASALPILSIAQPQSNHNGGWLGFGPNGYLYISSGDGGGSYDDDAGHDATVGNGQSLNTMLGKMLRVDINSDSFPADPNNNYAIPASNPFATDGGLPEIWAYGLRNAWRPSFDRATGNLWIADVGQGTREEIDFQPASSPGGINYGWRLREGLVQTPTAVGGPKPAGAVDPIFDYPHSGGGVSGISITGGYVYRGPIAELQGQYFFSDYGNPKLWTLTYDGSTLTGPVDLTSQFAPNAGAFNQIVSYGEDSDGNLYIVDLDGEIFKVGPEPAWIGASSTNNLWTTAANWGGVHPASGSQLKFDAPTSGGHTISHNDIIGTSQYNGLRFRANAAAYTLEGNAISLTGAVLNESANDQVLALPVLLAAGSGNMDTGIKNLTISGVISGSQGITKLGSGTLILKAGNLYTGNTIISQGTLALDGGDLADTSDISVANGANFAIISGTASVGNISGQGSTIVTGNDTVLSAMSIVQDSLTIGDSAAASSHSYSGGAAEFSKGNVTVPEPSILALFCVGGIGFACYVLRVHRMINFRR